MVTPFPVPGPGDVWGQKLIDIITEHKAAAVAEAAEAGNATYARPHLSNWRRKLVANPAAAKMVFVGDSTSDPITAAVNIKTRMTATHNVVGEGLSGLVAANVVMLGHSGVEQGAWATFNSGAYPAEVAAQNPDLIVYSLGLNTVRKGIGTTETLTAGIAADVDLLRAQNPNADIVLRIPNPITSDDVGGLALVTPNSSAQIYTDMLRNAYLALDNRWPNVVVWNAQDRLFGRVSKAMSLYGGLMADQLHPNAAGYNEIADLLVSDLLGAPRKYAPIVAVRVPVDIFAASRPANPYTMGDLVDRADSATGLGIASSGQAYTADGGTLGILNKRIYAPAAGSNTAVIDVGMYNGEFGITWTTVDANGGQWLVFRYADAANYLYARRYGTELVIGKRVANVHTVVSTNAAPSLVAGERLRIIANQASITSYINDVLIKADTITDSSAANKIGVLLTTTVPRGVDLYARKL